VQEEIDQPQQYDDVFFWQTHSADEHRDKKYGERYQFAGKKVFSFWYSPPPPVCLNSENFLVKQLFNKILKFLKLLKDLGFVF
jgi:hypothetical protein